jgi:hypothetical protein
MKNQCANTCKQCHPGKAKAIAMLASLKSAYDSLGERKDSIRAILRDELTLRDARKLASRGCAKY